MSELTEKTARKLLDKSHARGVIVALFGVDYDPSNTNYTCKFHPLIEQSIPSILRRMADDIDAKQDIKFKRTPKLVKKLAGYLK